MNWSDAHRVAMLAARRAHRDLLPDRDPSHPVDPFLAAQRAGLLVAFQPFGRLSGVYVRDQLAPGIAINQGHPLTRQRYTAAHELAHHLLDHATTVDNEIPAIRRFEGDPLSSDEMLAEAFASWLLMPDALVRAALSRMGIERPSIPRHVYQLALRVGASFEAVAVHLSNLRLATRNQSMEWLRYSRTNGLVALKEEISGVPLRANVSDVWRLQSRDAGVPLEMRCGDRAVVVLEEVPSSGYEWSPIPEEDWVLAADQTAVMEQRNGHVGQSTWRRFVLDSPVLETAINYQECDLLTQLARPWDTSDVARRLQFQIRLHAPKHGFLPEAFLVAA